jgi:uncharacterized protein (TIGR00369 family)
MTSDAPGNSDTAPTAGISRDAAKHIASEIPMLRFLGCRFLDTGDPDVVVVEMPNTASVQNRMGTPHGGSLAALADHTGGLAAALLTGRGGPTTDLHIRFLTVPADATVTAEARLLRDGGRLIVTEVRMFDGLRNLLAVATVSTAPSKTRGGPPPD